MAATLVPLGASASTTSLVSTTLAVSKSPAIDGTEVTWTGTVKPVSGTPSNVRLFMQSQWHKISIGSSFVVAGGECEPAAYCTVDERTGNPEWEFPTLTGPVTLTYRTLANSGATTSLFTNSEGIGCSGTCPATATIKVPTVGVQVAVVPVTTPVLPGTVLRVTVTGTATAGPMDATLQGKLSAGLAPATGITPSTFVYSPAPAHYVDGGTELNKSAGLTFDTVVTAPIGATVSITGSVWPVNAKYGDAQRTVSLTVGASPSTPKPTASAKPTPTAATAPTAGPSQPSETATPIPTEQPAPTAAPTPTPTITVASPSPDAPAWPTPSEPLPSPIAIDGTPSSGTGPPIALVLALATTIVAGAIGLARAARGRR